MPFPDTSPSAMPSMPSGSASCAAVPPIIQSSYMKGAGHPRPNQFRSTGNRRNRAVKTEGSKPSLGGTSRVTGDSQARICERLGVKFLGPTRPGTEPYLTGRPAGCGY
jgi:hypothetical protein